MEAQKSSFSEPFLVIFHMEERQKEHILHLRPDVSAIGCSEEKRQIAPQSTAGKLTVEVNGEWHRRSPLAAIHIRKYSDGIASMLYRDRLKSMQILLSRTQAGPGRAVKQEQKQTSRNHVQNLQSISVESEHLFRRTKKTVLNATDYLNDVT